MDFPRTAAVLPRVIWRAQSPSTNAELREIVETASAPLPHGTLLVTADQPAGRGRLGRGWVLPAGEGLATSVLLRAGSWGELSPGWLSLLAGVALSEALQRFFPPAAGLRVGVKWPNDVHVRDEDAAIAGQPGQKLCGVLCELLQSGDVIVGAGINLFVPEWELPTPRATSLLAAGGAVGEAANVADAAGAALADALLSDYTERLLGLVSLGAQDADAVRRRVLRASLTIGAEVRVHLPGGEVVDGRAAALAADGELVVHLPTGGELVVAAGDVEHLR